MALLIDLRITTRGTGTKSLGMLEIKRQEPLLDRENPQDETHRYVAHTFLGSRRTSDFVEIEHRYGDGAWKLVQTALTALNIEPEYVS